MRVRCVQSLEEGTLRSTLDWGLLEGHFVLMEEEWWAGLVILVCGNDGNLGEWMQPSGEGRQVPS